MVDRQGQDLHDHTWHDKQDKFSETTRGILGCCFEIINTLGSGFAESVYHNALVIALTDSGLEVSSERGFEVHFRGRKIGIFVPDLVVAKQVVVELKSCEYLTGEHQAQLINYLAVTNLSVGLLVNFGKRKLEYRRAYHPAYHATCDHANPVPSRKQELVATTEKSC
ncbi:MAG TPA: GxxExxY protein [Chlamydiales bacterium]|nr:GxxExxY protein [Chlamydiales bacterium]